MARRLTPEERATVIAALAWYANSGFGEPAKRPDYIHDLATDDNAVVSLDDMGVRKLARDIVSKKVG
jgi:hypothetical protein